VHTLNPESELKAATDARQAREKRISESEGKRWESIDKAISARPEQPPAPKPGEPGSVEAAQKAREQAEQKPKKQDGPPTQGTPPAPGTPPARETPPARGAPPAQATPSRVQSFSLASPNPENGKAKPQRTLDVIYVPTMDEAIDEMLALARVTSSDLLYDLGCGDGRIVIAAARKYGCRAIGFDIDPRRVAESQENVRKNGLANLVRIEERDIFDVDLSEADVVTLYLLPNLNVRLIPQIEKMKPGARIVSQDFDMAGVIPDRVVQVYLSKRQVYKSFYLWTVPLKLTDRPVPHEWTNASGIAV